MPKQEELSLDRFLNTLKPVELKEFAKIRDLRLFFETDKSPEPEQYPPCST